MTKPKAGPAEVLRAALALLLICAAAAGALAGVNAVTKAPIAANAEKEAGVARRLLFPGAAVTEKALGANAYYEARSAEGELLGYVIDTAAQGYGGEVRFSVGLSAEGKVLALRVLAADGETPGLGQKIKETSFLDQFRNAEKAVALGGGIDGVASATFSSRAAVEAVNQAFALFEQIQKGGVS
ncbi:MAG: FMN-binding protein [Oscillospiraceae bacterium]|jgi:electron transport complex protein RnfG|nr:FMN-binding protein [Oscillospiraceae bacterium]